MMNALKVGFGAALLSLAGAAAAVPDYSGLTVDVTGIDTAAVGIATAMLGVGIVFWALRKIMSLVG